MSRKHPHKVTLYVGPESWAILNKVRKKPGLALMSDAARLVFEGGIDNVKAGVSMVTMRARYRALADRLEKMAEAAAEKDTEIEALKGELVRQQKAHEFQKMRADAIVAENEDLLARVKEAEEQLLLRAREVRITEESHPVQDTLPPPPVEPPRFDPSDRISIAPPGLTPVHDTLQDPIPTIPRAIRPPGIPKPRPKLEKDGDFGAPPLLVFLAEPVILITLALLAGGMAFIWWIS